MSAALTPDKQQQESQSPTPPRVKVILWNDDDTPMDVVHTILCGIFNLTEPRALAVLLEAHTQGKAVVADYASRDVAETKATLAIEQARILEHPLLFTVEA